MGSGGCSPVVVHGLLIAVTSLVMEHGLWGMWAQEAWLLGSVPVAPGLSSCGSWAPEYRLSSLGTWA